MKSKPVSPCVTCDDTGCKTLADYQRHMKSPGDVKWGCSRYRRYIDNLIAFYQSPEGQVDPNSLSCTTCGLEFYNYNDFYVRRHKVVRKHTTVCMMTYERIGNRAFRGHHYPVWCPRCTYRVGCLYCGASLFFDEGDTCPRCIREMGLHRKGRKRK